MHNKQQQQVPEESAMKHSKMSQRIAYRKTYRQTALNDESMCTVENFISPARLWSETHNVIDNARPND
jgi:hypothetical protein